VDKRAMAPGTRAPLPKVRTHGIRGIDISGISFQRAFVPAGALLGGEGEGLQILLRGLQLTRVQCVGLSLGAADTALRVTLDFALHRKLYGEPVFAIPHAQRILLDAFVDLLVCECVSLCAARGCQVTPEQLSVQSSIAKYFVPVTVEALVHRLGTVLGARHFLREDHASGVFQKLMRDNAIVSVFDGSTAVNLNLLAAQLPLLMASEGRAAPPSEVEATLAQLCSLEVPEPALAPQRLRLHNGGRDDLLAGLILARPVVEDPLLRDVEPALLAEVERLRTAVVEEYRALARAVAQCRSSAKSPEMFDLAHRYGVLHAAAACFHVWRHNAWVRSPRYGHGSWLALGLERLLATFRPGLPLHREPAYARMAELLLHLHREDRLFSLTPLQLARREAGAGSSR
jgi:hypothetical protein